MTLDVKLSPLFNDQTLTAANTLASGYQLFTYAAGSSTKLTTYTDNTGLTAQTNPIILNGSGYPPSPIWELAGRAYKYVLALPTDTDPPASPVKTFDNISGVNDSSETTDQWVASGVTPTYINATTFTLVGDKTTDFHVGRRLKFTVTAGTVYGRIVTSVFATLTTVTVLLDSGSLDSGLSSIDVSILRADVSALPVANHNVTSLNDGPLAGLRNRIINGAMRTDQRNSGAAQTFTAAAALAYCVDGFYGYCTGANVTGQQVAGSGTSQFRYRFTGAASVTAIGFGQRIEQANSYDLNGTTATLSVDLANSLLTTVTWTAYYATTANTFGTLALPTRTQIATGTFTVTSTVTRYNAQISIPAAATTGVEIVLTVGAQISGTWTIGNVQLEPGSVATTFERRTPLELALCQRYYYEDAPLIGFSNGTTQAARASARHPVEMFAAPTVTVSNAVQFFDGAVATATGVIVNYSTTGYVQLDVTTNAVLTTGHCVARVAGTGKITVSAPL